MNETKDMKIIFDGIDESLPADVPPELIVHSEEELLDRLNEAEREIEEGKCTDVFEMLMRVRQEHGL